MIEMKKCLPVIALTMMICLGSCEEHRELERFLKEAGDNRSNLEVGLRYLFQIDTDEDNRALLYLLKHMPAHYSYSIGVDDYYDYASHIFADTSLTPEQQRDSILAMSDSIHRRQQIIPVSDARVIDLYTIVNNLYRSGEKRKRSPWASHLTFDEYLEWLLPYKVVEYQAFDNWRGLMSVYYGTGLYSRIKNDVEYNSTQSIAEIIRNEAYHKLNRYGLYTDAGLPLLNAHLMTHRTFGDIPDYAQIAVLAFRAAGVPAVLDETPVGSRYTAATQWPVILNERGEELTSEWDLATMIGGSFFPDERGPKVYRNTYAIDERRQRYKTLAKYQYPFSMCKKDVTSKYFLTSNIDMPIDRSFRRHLKDRYVYIASAVRDESNPWQIVDFGYMKRGKARFQDMGHEVLYTIMGYDGNGLIEITDPFILHKDGSIEKICADTLNSVNLDNWKNNAL